MDNITDILNNDRLVRQARALDDITTCVCRHLPPPLDKHCWVGGYSDTTLFLVTDNGSAVTLIQCHGNQILKQVNAEFGARTGHLRKVSVRVMRG